MTDRKLTRARYKKAKTKKAKTGKKARYKKAKTKKVGKKARHLGGSRSRSPRRRSRSRSPRRRSRSASPRRRSRSRSKSSSEKCPVCYEQCQLEKYHTCDHGICPECYATMTAVPLDKAGVGTGPKAVCPLCRAQPKPPDYRPEGYSEVATSFFCGCPDPEHCYHQ